MDTALQLRMNMDKGKQLSEQEIVAALINSALVQELTTHLEEKPMFYIWRLIALSEIPFANTLEYTQRLIERVYQKLSVSAGFSLDGTDKMFLPCYSAMVTSALCRLGRAGDPEVIRAIQWLNTWQPMERNIKVSIPGLNFERYGGCYRKTPCYISIAKTVIALWEYWKVTGDNSVRDKLTKGLEYILQHRLYKRLSNGQPITRHILDIAFPESYHLNIVELIRLISETGLLQDERARGAIDYLLSIKKPDGWQVTYRYKAQGFITFDKGRSKDWVTYVIEKALFRPNIVTFAY